MSALRKDRGFTKAMTLPIVLWTLCFVLLPLLYVFGVSFLRRGELGGVVAEVSGENYARLLSGSVLKVLLKSLRLAGLTTAVCVLAGFPFGYYMSRLKPGRRAIVLLLVMVPFWTNALIRIYGWRLLLMAKGPLDLALQALGLIQKSLKLLNTDGAVLLGMVYALLPLMILPAYTACEKLDFTCVEAARDLGAVPMYAFFTVTVPMTLSGLVTGATLVFIPSMGLFFLNDILGGSKNVLAGGLIQQYINSRDIPMAAALSMLMLVLTGGVLWACGRLGGSADGLF